MKYRVGYKFTDNEGNEKEVSYKNNVSYDYDDTVDYCYYLLQGTKNCYDIRLYQEDRDGNIEEIEW